MTAIKKAGKISAKDNQILLSNKRTNFSVFGLSNDEVRFVKEQLEKNEKKSALINRNGQVILVQTVETGKKPHLTHEAWRKAGAGAVVVANEFKISQLTVIDTLGDADATLAFTEGISLGNYQFLVHKVEPQKEATSLKTILVSSKKVKQKDLVQLQIVCDAVYKTRTLVNEPVNYLNAIQLAKSFEKMGKEAGFKVEVFNKSKIEALKMGGLLAVNLGSVDPPTFTVMEWKPKRHKNKKPIVLVGKGVVYDTGGLSLKPTANSMDLMKCDMGGSAAVAGAM